MKITFNFFFKAIKNYPLDFFKCLILVIFQSLISAFAPFGLKYYLDYITNNFDVKSIIIFVLLFILYLIIYISVTILWYRALDQFGGKYILDTLNNCEKKIINSMDFLTIEEEKNTKMKHVLYVDLLNTFTSIGHHLPSIIGSFLMVSALIIYSIFINYILALILLVSFIIGIFISYISRNFIIKASKKTNVTLKEIASISNEYVESIECLKTNDIFSYYQDQNVQAINKFIKVSKNEDTKTYFWAGLSEGYNSLIMYLISILLVAPFFDGSLANFAFFTLICTLILSKSQVIENNLRLVIKNEICFKNIDAYLSLKEVKNNTLEHITSIEFKDFSFKINDKIILNNINLSIKNNQICLIRGKNGSGKTTLIRCLMGLYHHYQGEIKINGEDKHYSLINKTLYISQNEKLMNTTIENYLYLITKKSLNEQEKTTFINKFSLNDDFFSKTIINQGENLSNGEKKKIQIIRLLLIKNDVDLFLLDEVLVSLDENTKHLYLSIVNDLKKEGKIVLMIEHGDNLEINFDNILDLN